MTHTAQPAFSHRYEHGRVFYSHAGLALKPRLAANQILIPWTNIDFISPTPAVVCKDGCWQTFDGKDLMASDALQRLSFFNIEVVVKNKAALGLVGGFREHLIFKLFFPERSPLYNAEDQPDACKAYFELAVKKGSLDAPLCRLLEFIQQHSRFDLLCHM